MANVTRRASVLSMPMIEGLEGRMLLSSAWVGTWNAQLKDLEIQNGAIVQSTETNVATITQLGAGSFRLSAPGFSIDLTGNETKLTANLKGQSDGPGDYHDEYFRLQKFDNSYVSIFSGRIDYNSATRTQITSANVTTGLANMAGTTLNVVSFPWAGNFTFHGLGLEATFNGNPRTASSTVYNDTKPGVITTADGLTYQVGPVGQTPETFTLSGNQLVHNYRGLDNGGLDRVKTLSLLTQGPGGRLFNGGLYFDTTIATGRINYVSLDSGYSDPFNAAPILSATPAMYFDTINEDDRANVGTSIRDLIDRAGANNITDADAGADEGIALTAVNTACGKWQYSTNGGTTWTNVGVVSGTSALLLGSDAQNLLRLVPKVNFSGNVANAITFRAWDQTARRNGVKANVSGNGGFWAYSSATATVRIRVRNINDAPVVTAATARLTGALMNSPYPISFDKLAAAIQAVTSYSDVDNAQASLGFRITALSGSLKSGGAAMGSGPVLLMPGQSMVWRPAAGATGKITALQVEIWDGNLPSTAFVTVIIKVI